MDTDDVLDWVATLALAAGLVGGAWYDGDLGVALTTAGIAVFIIIWAVLVVVS